MMTESRAREKELQGKSVSGLMSIAIKAHKEGNAGKLVHTLKLAQHKSELRYMRLGRPGALIPDADEYTQREVIEVLVDELDCIDPDEALELRNEIYRMMWQEVLREELSHDEFLDQVLERAEEALNRASPPGCRFGLNAEENAWGWWPREDERMFYSDIAHKALEALDHMGLRVGNHIRAAMELRDQRSVKRRRRSE